MKALAYRKSDAGDLPFIVHGFLDSFRTSPSAGLIAMKRWRAVMEPEILDILARPGIDVWVAHHPGELERRADLYGFVIVERGYLDNTRRPVDDPLVVYCYVKKAYRKLGIARGLFKAAAVGERFNYATETSDVGELRRAGKLPGARRKLHLVVRFPKHHEEKAA